jgi:hypothetical protein
VRATDAPVLVERRRALDRRLVHALTLVNIVRATVGGHSALVGEPTGRIVGAEVLGDVVLDERVRRPAVHGEVRIARRRVVGTVADGPVTQHKMSDSVWENNASNLLGRSRVPTLPGDEVAAVLPGNTVLARGTVGVRDSSSTVGPERIVETVVGSGTAGGAGTVKELGGVDERSVKPVSRQSQGADDGRGGEDNRSEGDHDSCQTGRPFSNVGLGLPAD